MLITATARRSRKACSSFSGSSASVPRPSTRACSAPALATLSRAGIALGVIDAAALTMITRKVTAPVLFDETPVGLRRRRTMAEGGVGLEDLARRVPLATDGAPTLDAICAVVALDYLRFRFVDAPWMPPVPTLDALSQRLRERQVVPQDDAVLINPTTSRRHKMNIARHSAALLLAVIAATAVAQDKYQAGP